MNNPTIDWQLSAHTPIAIAVSGGPDSMALLHLAKQHFTHITALTVDHSLRDNSAAEAEQVKLWCNRLEVPHHTLLWQHDEIHSGMPEKARDARYALMQDWCTEHHISHLFTAHHADDQIETVLFRLLKKSNIEGLSGIPPLSKRGALTLHRPLLGCFKQELLEWLQAKKISYINDLSNQNLRYSRNALRAQFASLSGDQKKRILALAQSFSRIRQTISRQLEAQLDRCLIDHILDKSAFSEAPPELQWRMVQAICQQVSGNFTPLRSEKIHRLTALLSATSPPKKHTLHGVIFLPLNDKKGWRAMPEFNGFNP